MSRRSGLGRGLAALIPPSVPAASETPDRDDASASEAAVTVDEPTSPSAGEEEVAAANASEPVVATSAVAPMPVVDLTESMERGRDASDVNEMLSAAPLVEEPREHSGENRAEPGRPTGGPEAVQDPTARRPSTPSADARQVPSAAATLAEVAPGSIVPNPRQPREVFDPDELANLATSLADVGVLQPLVVRPLADGRYELVAGERRLRAATLAGLETVPVVIRHTDDADLLKEALVENIHRVQLNPLEEGAAYQQLLEEFGVTQEELAARLGRSRPSISNAIRLLQLPSGVQRRVASGVLSAGHAKVLLAIEDPDQQVRLADRIVAEGMSVRATEELVRLRLLDAPGPTPSSRRRPAAAPGLVELQDDLSDALAARVRISMGAKKGKLAIDFASVDDLERIVSVIANGLEGGRRVSPSDAGPGGPPPEPGGITPG